jgi:hypothetical protein
LARRRADSGGQLSTIVLGANRIKESLVVVIGAVDPVEKGLF